MHRPAEPDGVIRPAADRPPPMSPCSIGRAVCPRRSWTASPRPAGVRRSAGPGLAPYPGPTGRAGAGSAPRPGRPRRALVT